VELGPKVGAKVPDFTVVATSGEKLSRAALTGRSGVTLVFFRSADWCPFCKMQLKDLNGVAEELAALGWPLVGVSYDPAETLTAFSLANGLKYSLMTDPGSKAIDAFGIRNETVKGSARFDGIPHPIILFIGRDGIVKAKLYEEAYQKRPPSGLVLETAKGLK
jgi:peroxiredoxin